MARKSSLEGRLHAVLSEKLNRRGVSLALAAIALAMTVAIAVPITMLRAAEEKPGEKPKPTATDMKPKGGEKLDPATEKRLRWGKPVKGLRAALLPSGLLPASRRPATCRDLYLAVQNVSDAPIRLSDTTAAPKLRELYIKMDGVALAEIGSKGPTGTDVILQPREVVFLLMFVSDWRSGDGRTSGSFLAEEACNHPHETLFAEMQIEACAGRGMDGQTPHRREARRSGGGKAAAKRRRRGRLSNDGRPIHLLLPPSFSSPPLRRRFSNNGRPMHGRTGRYPAALIGKLGVMVKYLPSRTISTTAQRATTSQ